MLPSSDSRTERPPRCGFRSDAGSASLEFVTAGALLLVPVVYLVLTLGMVQGAAFAAEGAAHASARAYVQALEPAEGRTTVDEIVRLAAADFSLDDAPAATEISCVPATADCLQRDSVVTVTVTLDVPLPLVPSALDSSLPLHIPVTATAVQRVSAFRGELQ
jgi:hypothetical protein